MGSATLPVVEAYSVLEADGLISARRGYPAMRLNFSHSPDDIDKGLSILGTLVNATHA